MVDMKTSMRGREQSQAQVQVNENPRNANRKRRLQVLKDAHAGRGSIRVVPKNEKLRAVLKHQPSGIGFRAEGGVEWPNDRFTQRRLRDGDIKIEVAKPQEEKKPEKRASSQQSPERT